MSICSRMHDRLCKLYRLVLVHMRNVEAAITVPSSLRKPAGVSMAFISHQLESMEPRVLLSSSATTQFDADIDDGQSQIVYTYDAKEAEETGEPDDEFNIQDVTGPQLLSRASEDVLANGQSGYPTMSADGRFVVFESLANNLVEGDLNNVQDIYLYDNETGMLERVSLSYDGSPENISSYRPTISANGRYVLYQSGANNIVPDDTNTWPDSFVYDRETGLTERVSVTSEGVQANSGSSNSAISDDGRIVVFINFSTNLVPGDTNKLLDVFVHNRETGQTKRVNVSNEGAQTFGYPQFTSISADGRFVAFNSVASNQVSGDTNKKYDVFVYDLQTEQVERVSVSSSGKQGNGDSSTSSMSGDGRYVTFQSEASNLVTGDTNGVDDIFVFDRVTRQTERVSVSQSGVQANGKNYEPQISADGRYVTFMSEASNLVPDDTNGKNDIFVYDRHTGEIQRVNVDANGEQANDDSRNSDISADGRYVTFMSKATNLIEGNSDSQANIFYVDLGARELVPEALVQGNGLTITLGDTSPSVLDDTDFGTADVNGSTVSRTFTVFNTGTAALTTSSLSVPAGFTITEGISASIAAGESDTFTVRMNTTAAGIKTGQITFTTNDFDETSYSFSIKGDVRLPTQINLTATLDDSRIPTDIVSGTATKITLPITVSNESFTALERNAKISVQIVARPVGGGDDILLATLTDQNVSALGAGKSKTLKATFTLPADVATNDYVLVAKIDSTDVIDEVSEDDNEAVGTVTIAIAEGNVNLTATLDERKIPTDIVAGTATKISLPIIVTNEGNIPVERNVKISVQIVARPVGGGDDILLTTLTDQSISNLGVGKSKTLKATFTLPADVATNDYVLVAVIDSADVVDESNEDDNEAEGEATIAIAEGNVNLAATLDERKIPTDIVAGTATKISLPIIVTNEGNIPVERNVKISVQIVARPVGGGDDILLTTLTDQSISNLGVGKSKTLKATFTLPADVATNDYVLVAVIDSADVVDESNEDDNEAEGEETIAIAEGNVNLTVALNDSKIATSIEAGSNAKITLPFTITNEGNIPVDRDVKITVQIAAKPVGEGDTFLIINLADQNISSLAVGKSKSFKATFTVPEFIDPADYVLTVRVDSQTVVDESNEDDNLAIGTKVIAIS